MLPSQSPFPCRWWGIGLEDAGLGDVRPDVGTYGRYEFDRLPPVPFEMHGDFAWLATAPKHDRSIGEEKLAENAKALPVLRNSSTRVGLQLPQLFIKFMTSPALHERIRSNTDCFVDLCSEPVSLRIGGVRPPVMGNADAMRAESCATR